MRIVITDDHPLVMEALRSVVLSFLPAADVLRARNLLALIPVLHNRAEPVDLLLIDVQLEHENALDWLETSPRELTDTRVIVYTGGGDAMLQRAQAMGHMAVSKRASSDVLVRAIRAALGFKIEDEPALTARQCELMDLLTLGNSNQQIADRLRITESTVKSHVSQIFDRLGVQSRSQAVRRYASVIRVGT